MANLNEAINQLALWYVSRRLHIAQTPELLADMYMDARSRIEKRLGERKNEN